MERSLLHLQTELTDAGIDVLRVIYADILGTTLTFGGVQNGKATLSVGGASVTCGEGETVTAGPLQIECSGVTDDSVEVKASLG